MRSMNQYYAIKSVIGAQDKGDTPKATTLQEIVKSKLNENKSKNIVSANILLTDEEYKLFASN